jgi:hypothetical protein
MPLHEGVPAEPVDVADVARRCRRRRPRTRRPANSAARSSGPARTWPAAGIASRPCGSSSPWPRSTLRSGEEAVATLERRVAEARDVDTAPLLSQIRDAEATSREVRENQQRASVAAEHTLGEAESTTLTESIAALDRGKAAAIAAAIPVPGLGFSAAGAVTLNELPLEQASAAERPARQRRDRHRQDPAAARPADPRRQPARHRVDAHGRRARQGFRSPLWVERVGSDSPSAVVIEDGMVVGVSEPAGAEAST